MIVTIQYDLEKEVDRQEYQLITKSGFMKETLDALRDIIETKEVLNKEELLNILNTYETDE